jgi:hypothetical protein
LVAVRPAPPTTTFDGRGASVRLTACVVLGVAITATAAGQPAERGPAPHLAAEEIERLVGRVLKAQQGSSPERGSLGAALAYRDLFTAAGRDGVGDLRAHPNDGIAVRAAWESVRSGRQSRKWFVGFLEGRARVRAPDWWAAALTHGQPLTGAPGAPDDPYHEAGPGFGRAPKDTTLARDSGDDAAIVVRVGGEAVRVPADVARRLRRPAWRNVSALALSDRCYLAAHDDVGAGYPLACLDRRTGKAVWEAGVWGHWSGAATGPHAMWVSVTRQADRVVVFGASLTGYHVEAFRADDGKCVFRFSTEASPE